MYTFLVSNFIIAREVEHMKEKGRKCTILPCIGKRSEIKNY